MSSPDIISEHKEHTVVLKEPNLAASPQPVRGDGTFVPDQPADAPGPVSAAQPVASSAPGATRQEQAPGCPASVIQESQDAGAAPAPAGLADDLLRRVDLLRTMNADLRRQLEQFTGSGRSATEPRAKEKSL